MSRPAVTVLMPTYNGARHIRETIASILAQSFTDFEFLIIDDGSTDDTVAIVRACPEPRIRLLVNPENLGIPRTRNRGLDEAAGTYVAMTDHDDLSAPTRLAEQVALLERRPDIMLVGTGSLDLRDGRLSACPIWTGAPALRWRLLTHCPFSHSSACFRLADLRAHHLRYREDIAGADDHDLFYRIGRLGGIECLDEHLLTYRLHAHNTSRVQHDKSAVNGKRVLADICRETLGAPVGERMTELAWRFVSNAEPAPSAAVLDEIGGLLSRLLAACLADEKLPPADRASLGAAAASQWWHIVQAAVKRHGPRLYHCYRAFPELAAGHRPGAAEQARLWAVTLAGPRLAGTLRRARDALAR